MNITITRNPNPPKLSKNTQIGINLINNELLGRSVELTVATTTDHFSISELSEDQFQHLIIDSHALRDVVLVSDCAKAIYKQFPHLITQNITIKDITLASYVNNGSGKHDLATQTDFFGLQPDLPQTVKILLLDHNWHEIMGDQAKKLWTVENEVARILAFMELEGVKIDEHKLLSLKESYYAEASQLTTEIRELLGTTAVNINSNKQLGEALVSAGFKLGRPGKSGAPSIKESVLQSLQERDKLGVIQKIIDYRTVQKMYSTYTDSLLVKIDSSGRLHGEYNQTVAATGRLSSANPNLQNIPIRHPKYGSDLRSVFVAKDGYSLISADYSQIELRILAHLTQDPRLLQAFRNGEDIHSVTASEVFGVSLETVTKSQRSVGKTLNFALMYQQGHAATGKQLSIPSAEAKHYHEKFFEQFATIKPYINSVLREAEKTGYAQTMYGRRAYYPDLLSTNGFLKSNAQRASFNMPIQGAEADIVKMAMIRLEHDLAKAQLDCTLILQIHDEIVFEVADRDLQKSLPVITSAMELDQPLTCPLEVLIHSGKNWNEAK